MANGYGGSTSSSYSGTSVSRNTNTALRGVQTNEIRKIRNLLIDTSEMPSTVVSRRLIVNGSIGASFVLQIINNPTSSSAMTKYYNFISTRWTRLTFCIRGEISLIRRVHVRSKRFKFCSTSIYFFVDR